MKDTFFIQVTMVHGLHTVAPEQQADQLVEENKTISGH
jgi:hypothetical protein